MADLVVLLLTHLVVGAVLPWRDCLGFYNTKQKSMHIKHCPYMFFVSEAWPWGCRCQHVVLAAVLRKC